MSDPKPEPSSPTSKDRAEAIYRLVDSAEYCTCERCE